MSLRDELNKAGIKPRAAGGSLRDQLEASGVKPRLARQDQKEKGGFVEGAKEFGREIARPFARTAVSGIQAARGVAGLGKAAFQTVTGDEAAAAQTIRETGRKVTAPLDVPGLGDIKPVTTPREALGVGLEVGTSIAPVGRGLSLAKRAGVLATGGLGFEFGRQLEEGEPISPVEAAKTAGISAVLPFAGRALSKITKGAGKAAGAIVGKSTGSGFEAVKQAFQNPNVIKFARQATREGPEGILTDALDKTRGALSVLKNNRAKAYQVRLAKIKTDPVKLQSTLGSVKNKVVELQEDLRTIVEGRNVVDRAIQEVVEFTDVSAVGLDTLKRRLSSFQQQLTAPGKKQAQRIVTILKDEVRQGLNKNVKGYEEMTKAWGQASQVIDEINKTLSLGAGKQKDTAIRKLMSTMRTNNELRREMIQVLQEATGDDVLGRIAGATLGERAPRGIIGAISPTGAIAGGLLAPQFWSHILILAATSSPRVMAEVVNILGRVTDQMVRANKFSPEIERALRLLLQQAAAERKGLGQTSR